MSEESSKENQLVTQSNNRDVIAPPELSHLKYVSGSNSAEFSHILVNQVFSALWVADRADTKQWDKQIDATLIAMMGVKPTDEIEGMMAAQMVATHNAAMECFKRAMIKDQHFESRKENLNQANKLTRSYSTLVESLNRYRGKGISEQKVTVQHVHVSEGGQAIVGNVEQHREGG